MTKLNTSVRFVTFASFVAIVSVGLIAQGTGAIRLTDITRAAGVSTG